MLEIEPTRKAAQRPRTFERAGEAFIVDRFQQAVDGLTSNACHT
jgi:hypothetical protein